MINYNWKLELISVNEVIIIIMNYSSIIIITTTIIIIIIRNYNIIRLKRTK